LRSSVGILSFYSAAIRSSGYIFCSCANVIVCNPSVKWIRLYKSHLRSVSYCLWQRATVRVQCWSRLRYCGRSN